jgi:hypothetical protein
MIWEKTSVEGRNDEAFARRARRELSYSTQVHGRYLAQTRAAPISGRRAWAWAGPGFYKKPAQPMDSAIGPWAHVQKG